MLYSYKNDTPDVLPERIVLSDGSTRTDKTSFTEQDLADAGYVLAPDYPSIEKHQKCEWNGTNWIVRDKNEAEKQQEWRDIREICLTILKDTDFKVLKAYEAGTTVDSRLTEYRQAIRNLYNNVDNIDPWNANFPLKPQLD